MIKVFDFWVEGLGFIGGSVGDMGDNIFHNSRAIDHSHSMGFPCLGLSASVITKVQASDIISCSSHLP